MFKKLIDKIVGFITLKDDEYDDYEDYGEYSSEDDIADEPDFQDEPEPAPKKRFGRSRGNDVSEESEPVQPSSRSEAPRNYSRPGRSYSSDGGNTSKVYYFKPQRLSDARAAADCLINGHVVIINFAGADLLEGQRIIDFLMGTSFALGGNLQKINDSIFIITNSNVTISQKENKTAWI